MLAAAWLTAAATGLLALFAVITAIFAIKAYGGQSIEVRLLIAERKREAEQRHRAQRAQVFTWPGEAPLRDAEDIRAAAFIRNSSSQPVYEISIGWAGTAQAAVPRLMPGQEYCVPGAGTSAADGTHAEFRDAAGVRWRTTSAGDLKELQVSSDDDR
jgi:hypothetical protein